MKILNRYFGDKSPLEFINDELQRIHQEKYGETADIIIYEETEDKSA